MKQPDIVAQDRSEMNVLFIHSELDDAGLTPQEFRVYAHLSRRAGKGRAYPGIDSMAEKCRVSKNTVTEAIKKLEKLGMIEVTRIQGERNAYVLTKRSSWLLPDRPKSDNGDEPVPIGVTDHPISDNGTVPNGVTKGNPDKVIHKGALSSLHATMIEKWCKAYEEHFGCKYAFQGGKDAKAIQSLLAQTKLSPDELMAIAKEAWKRGTGFYCKSATSLTGFYSKFNEIRQELKTDDQKTSGRGSVNASNSNAAAAKEYQ